MNKTISLGFWMAVMSVIFYSCGTDNSEKEPSKAEVLAEEVRGARL